MHQTKATADFHKYAADLPPEKKKKSFLSSSVGKGLLGGGLAVGALGAGLGALSYVKGGKPVAAAAKTLAKAPGAAATEAAGEMMQLPATAGMLASEANTRASAGLFNAGIAGTMESAPILGPMAGAAWNAAVNKASLGEGVKAGLKTYGKSMISPQVAKLTPLAEGVGVLNKAKILGGNTLKTVFPLLGSWSGYNWGNANADDAINAYGKYLPGGAPPPGTTAYDLTKGDIAGLSALAGMHPVGFGVQFILDGARGAQDYFNEKDSAAQLLDASRLEKGSGKMLVDKLNKGILPQQTAQLLVNPDGSYTDMGKKYMPYISGAVSTDPDPQ